MRHARAAALDAVEPLLAELRARQALRERRRGVFYLRSNAFLHFHEDAAGIFADVRLGDGFERMRATTTAEWRRLLTIVDARLARVRSRRA